MSLLYNGKQLQTTINFSLQKRINLIAKNHYLALHQNQINNLAVLVLDVKTRNVLAYVGNAPTTIDNQNYVNVIDKPRSTGSLLKPFLFASLLDAGELLPNTLVADIPTIINGYSPTNFSKNFNGAVPARIALSRSLNVPAVRMLRRYGLQRFYKKLKKTGFSHISKPPDYYGLSLILGGAESSLWEITSAYAAMASTVSFFNHSSSEYRKNEFLRSIILNHNIADFGKITPSPPIYNAGAIYQTLDALKEVNRPQGEENWQFYSDAQPIAWKTGTSYGFKDAWAVGVTPQFAIGVWVGNADGEGRPGLTGIQAATPALFDVLAVLPNNGSWFKEPYDEMVKASICRKSGFISSIYCSETQTQWIVKTGLKTKMCPYHHPVFLDKTQQFRVNSSCYDLSKMVKKNWFSLPPFLEYYYAPLHPEYKPLPLFKQDCLQNGETRMQFIYPKKGETIIVPKTFEQNNGELVFKVIHRNPESTLYCGILMKPL